MPREKKEPKPLKKEVVRKRKAKTNTRWLVDVKINNGSHDRSNFIISFY